ncbi:MAG: DUF2617 family protein [Sedimentisphaerales bacterium]|nr:DUF2617 family protein [Sedimentisphaerales bacterium]
MFTIYRSRQFFQGDYEVNIWVTGCSHVISVFYNNDCVTELISPPEHMLPTRGLVERFAFRGEKSHAFGTPNGLHYMMNLQVEHMSDNLYRQTHIDLIKMAKKRGIFVPYPQWARGTLAPFSLIDYEAHFHELHLHTFHAFPDQHTILKSQSLFSMRNNSLKQ